MIAALATADPPDARARTEVFFRSFCATAREGTPLLRRIAAAYGELGERVVADDDVRLFVTFLYQCARHFRPRIVVQTGTAAGTSSVALGLALRDNGSGTLLTIDPEPPEYFGVPEPVAIAREAVSRAGLDHVVRFVRGYSTIPLDAGRMTLPRAARWRLASLRGQPGVDMLVVDGDHTFLGCYLDLHYGHACLAPDGPRVIVCHDYCGIPEVKQAIKRWERTVRPRDMRLVPSPCGIRFLQV